MFWLRFCTGFFVVGRLFVVLAGGRRWSSTAVTGGRFVAVGWRWCGVVGSCRVGSRYVGARSGTFLFFGVGAHWVWYGWLVIGLGGAVL